MAKVFIGGIKMYSGSISTYSKSRFKKFKEEGRGDAEAVASSMGSLTLSNVSTLKRLHEGFVESMNTWALNNNMSEWNEPNWYDSKITVYKGKAFHGMYTFTDKKLVKFR